MRGCFFLNSHGNPSGPTPATTPRCGQSRAMESEVAKLFFRVPGFLLYFSLFVRLLACVPPSKIQTNSSGYRRLQALRIAASRKSSSKRKKNMSLKKRISAYDPHKLSTMQLYTIRVTIASKHKTFDLAVQTRGNGHRWNSRSRLV